MADDKPIDPDVLAYLESVKNSLTDLSDNVVFLLNVTETTQQILIRLAYVLERVSNSEFDLEEKEDEPSRDRIEKAFREIRELFEKQLVIARGEDDE